MRPKIMNCNKTYFGIVSLSFLLSSFASSNISPRRLRGFPETSQDNLTAYLANTSVPEELPLAVEPLVQIPLSEYVVLREIRDALAGLDSYHGWVGDTTECHQTGEGTCECSWDGIQCKYRQDLEGWRISSISLSSRKLQGTIPVVVSGLEGLEVLNLAYNRLTGTLPPSFSGLKMLRTLYLHSNLGLNGPLPAGYSALEDLERINLSGNSLTGTLPESWHELPSTSALDLSRNQLSGTLPRAWSELEGLEVLNLDNNLLIGTLPKEWTSLGRRRRHQPPLELNIYDNMLLDPVPDDFRRVAPSLTVNFYPQDGQIRARNPHWDELRNRSELEHHPGVTEDFWDLPLPKEHGSEGGTGPYSALAGWLSALVLLLCASAAWLCGVRRLRNVLRKRRFHARCKTLTFAERCFLDEHSSDVLLEYDGTSHPTAKDVPDSRASCRSTDSVLEMGLLAQHQSSRPTSSSTGCAGCAAVERQLRHFQPPSPGHCLPAMRQALMTAEELPVHGRLGRCYSAQLFGHAVVVKAVEAPVEPGLSHSDPNGLMRLEARVQMLRSMPLHPNLLTPAKIAIQHLECGQMRICLAYDRAPCGSLEDWLTGSQPGGMAGALLPWPMRLRHAQEAAEGLVALSKFGTAHGALHPANALLDGAMHLRLVHFGIVPLLLEVAHERGLPWPADEGALPPPAGAQSGVRPPRWTDSSEGSPFLAAAEPDIPPGSSMASSPSRAGSGSSSSWEDPHGRSVPYSRATYTDPAYLHSGELGPAADLYSFGVLLLQLVTGSGTAEGLVGRVRGRLSAVGGLQALRGGGLTPAQAEEVRALADPRAGEWPVSSAAALLGIAMACTEPRPRHRPDLRFHVLPKLTVLARKASPWLPAPPGPVSFGAGLPSERASLCPILREPMQDPVVAADGYTYERRAIQRWFDEMAASGKPLASPMTGLPLPSTALYPARGNGPPPSGPRAPAGAEGLKDA